MKSEQIILGSGCVYSTNCAETQINNNVIVVGGTGSGKTMSVMEPKLLETIQSSLIVTVSKRYLVKKYTPLFLKRGYKVWDLNLSAPEKSNVSYDPLQFIKSYADINFLAAEIVNANPKKQKNTTADPYWDQGAQSLLAAEIAYTLMAVDNATFLDVLTLHESLEITENGGTIRTTLDSEFGYIERKEPNCFAIRCWKSFRQLPVKTALCIFSTLNVTMDTVFTPELKACMNKKEKIDFKTSKNVSLRLNLPLDDVLYMPIGTVAIFRRGQRPFITQRYSLQEHPLYEQLSSCKSNAYSSNLR